MKKALTLVFLSFSLFFLMGCNTDTSSETQAQITVLPTTEIPTLAPTSKIPTTKSALTEKPTEKPTEKLTEKPSLPSTEITTDTPITEDPVLITGLDFMVNNMDLFTINDYKFVAQIVYGTHSEKATIYLNDAYQFVGQKDGEDISQAIKNALPAFILGAEISDLEVNVESFDQVTKELVISVDGYKDKIYIKITVNDSLDEIILVSFVSSKESYRYSPTYPGREETVVEKAFIDEFNTNGLVLDSIGGASVTSSAMEKAMNWIILLEESFLSQTE